MGSIKRGCVGILVAFFALSFLPQKADAQVQDIQQLVLDIEKLTQFKAILSLSLIHI